MVISTNLVRTQSPLTNKRLRVIAVWLPFECICHNRRFAKKAELNRHLNKENQLYKCLVEGCPSRESDGSLPCFGTLNDQKRHYRDVHSTTLDGRPLARFNCPWPTCNRHGKGFPRKPNLDNHLKSYHKGQVPAEAPATIAEAGPSSIAPNDTMASLAPRPQQSTVIAVAPAAASVPHMLQLDPDEESDEVLTMLFEDSTDARNQLQSLQARINKLQEEQNQLQTEYNAMARTEERNHLRLANRRKVLRMRREARRN